MEEPVEASWYLIIFQEYFFRATAIIVCLTMKQYTFGVERMVALVRMAMDEPWLDCVFEL